MHPEDLLKIEAIDRGRNFEEFVGSVRSILFFAIPVGPGAFPHLGEVNVTDTSIDLGRAYDTLTSEGFAVHSIVFYEPALDVSNGEVVSCEMSTGLRASDPARTILSR